LTAPTTGSLVAPRSIWFLADTSGIGGVERHIATLANSLQRHGHPVEVVVYGPHGASQWFEQLSALGLRKRTLDNTFGGLVRALRAHRPALLHVHGYKAAILGRLAARLTGTPVVASNHESERGRYPLNVYRIVDDWLSILSPTIGVSAPIAARIPFNSVHIPNFTDLPSAPTDTALPMRVAFVGRLADVKRPDLYCDVAARAPPSIAFDVYGDGPLRAALEAQHGHRVTFHGMVSDLAPVWPTIGLLLMTSDMEGQPYAALEAMSHGIPVAASRVGGMLDLIAHGETGWLFEPGDVAGALAALDTWRSLSPAEAAALRRRCWQRVHDTFSEEAVLPRLMDVYARAGYR
jgi:glycosyltransferase involved in cell wall biosynthesis